MLDVVISSRSRIARNLRGFAYPHRMDRLAAARVIAEVQEAVVAAGLRLKPKHDLNLEEIEQYVAQRLLSPHFLHPDIERGFLIDNQRSLSLMVNEEDHVRLQAIYPGFSLTRASSRVEATADRLESCLDFAKTSEGGYFAASPINMGIGERHSIMCHLVGLAHTRRLRSVLMALGHHQWVVRGVFGESTRAVGALFQISGVDKLSASFLGACEHLIAAEREARRSVNRNTALTIVMCALESAVASRSLTTSDAIRCLSWARWAVFEGLVPDSSRAVDRFIALQGLNLAGNQEWAQRNRFRADTLRPFFEQCLRTLRQKGTGVA